MRIDRLTLTNFRGFEQWGHDFAPEFNVLIGDNGAGKTTVLDALAVALNPVVYSENRSSVRNIQKDDLRYLAGETPFEAVVATTGEYNGVPLEWKRWREPGNSPHGNTRAISQAASDLWQKMRLSESVTAPVISYYTTARRWQRKPDDLGNLASPGSRLLGYSSALTANANDDFLFRWFKTIELASFQERRVKDSPEEYEWSVIQNAIAGCMEGPRNFLSFSFSDNDIVVRRGNKTFPEWEDFVPFRMLSDGQRNIAALVLDIAYRCVTLNPHLGDQALLETPGVVLIDEIDLHLHPNWQRRIVGDLRRTFPKVQFIVATHSPIIIQSLKADSDRVIDLSGGEFPLHERSSPEDILKRMGVEMPQQSADWLRLFHAAQEYYALLDQAKDVTAAENGVELQGLRAKLDALSIPFEDNPAWAALLERKRAAAGIDPDTTGDTEN